MLTPRSLLGCVIASSRAAHVSNSDLCRVDKGPQALGVLGQQQHPPSQSGALHSRRSRPTPHTSLRCRQRDQLPRAMQQLPLQDLPAEDGLSSVPLAFLAPTVLLILLMQVFKELTTDAARYARQKNTRFSDEERNALIEGVFILGTGHWAAILDRFSTVFAPGRNSVDLKDKWRNLVKAAKSSGSGREQRGGAVPRDQVIKIMEIVHREDHPGSEEES